ncbi:MAG: hypothetical protein R3F34_04020 [Planctomycetota bacterium]
MTWISQVPSLTFYRYDVHAVRSLPDGTVLDPSPITVWSASGSSTISYDVTAMGSTWVVIAQDTSAGNGGIQAVRVDANGTVIDPTPVMLVPPTFFLYFGTSVTATQNQLLLVYTAQSNYVGRFFDANLNQIGSSFTPKSGQISSNGTGYYVTWATGSERRGSPMDTNGTLRVPNGTVIGSTTSAGTPHKDSIDWDGTSWWIAWNNVITGIEVARVRANGLILDQAYSIDPAGASTHNTPSLCTVPGGGVRVAWSDFVGTPIGSYDVMSAKLTGPTAIDPTETLSIGAPAQTRTELAVGPNDTYLVTALSRYADAHAIVAWERDRYGNPLGDAFTVATGNNLGMGGAAWNGQEWLVTWADDGTILGRRYDGSLAPIDGSPFTVMSGFSADVSALGDDFLVVGTDYGTSIQFLFPFAMRVDGPTGALLDPQPILLGQSFAQLPRVVTVAGKWLVTWQRNFTHDDPQAAIEAAFVDATGATAGSFVVLQATGGQPDVATNDSEVLFVWRGGSLSNANNSVRARLMDATGSFLTADFLVSDAGGRRFDSPSRNGDDFLVAWEDMRDRTSFFDERTWIYGARVSTGGAVLDPGGFPIAAGGDLGQDPAAASIDGDVLVAYARFDSTPGVASWRASARRVGFWQDLGEHLAGTNGDPVLDALGDRAPNSTFTLQVSNAAPVAFGWYVIGTSEIALPIFGGVLTPSPDFLLAYATDGLGVSSLTHTFPATIPPGTSLYLQAWTIDLAATQSLSASNAVVHTAP